MHDRQFRVGTFKDVSPERVVAVFVALGLVAAVGCAVWFGSDGIAHSRAKGLYRNAVAEMKKDSTSARVQAVIGRTPSRSSDIDDLRFIDEYIFDGFNETYIVTVEFWQGEDDDREHPMFVNLRAEEKP